MQSLYTDFPRMDTAWGPGSTPAADRTLIDDGAALATPLLTDAPGWAYWRNRQAAFGGFTDGRTQATALRPGGRGGTRGRLRPAPAGHPGERQDALPRRQGRGRQARDRGPVRPGRAGRAGRDVRQDR